MTRRDEPTRLDVTSAMEHGALRFTRGAHRTTENPTIDSVALIARPEQARRVALRAAVVIAAGPETRGWLVSSVLRYAWERRASLVIAAGAQPDSVLVLAQRLDITLLTTDADPTTLALNLAADIGAANAAIEAQLVSLMRVVTRERTVDGILRVASAELGGVPLELAFHGSLIARAGTSDRMRRSTLGPYAVVESGGEEVTVSAYPLRAGGHVGFAESALELILPALRAAWFEMEFSDRTDGLSTAAAVTDGSFYAGPTPPYSALVSQLGWRDNETHLVVFLKRSTDGSQAMSNAVRLLWRRAMGRSALTEIPGGWIAVLRADDESSEVKTVRRLRTKLSPSFGELGVGIGVSSVGSVPDRMGALVTEARIAARNSWAAGVGNVASFGDLELSAIEYLFDPDDARTIARLVLPQFYAAPDRAKLVESVGAVLSEGSVSAAATALGLHRNTLTARLDRARLLGLPVGEPRLAFAVAAVVRALNPGTLAFPPTVPTNEGNR